MKNKKAKYSAMIIIESDNKFEKEYLSETEMIKYFKEVVSDWRKFHNLKQRLIKIIKSKTKKEKTLMTTFKSSEDVRRVYNSKKAFEMYSRFCCKCAKEPKCEKVPISFRCAAKKKYDNCILSDRTGKLNCINFKKRLTKD